MHWEMMGCLQMNLLLTRTHIRQHIWSPNLSGNTLTFITGSRSLINCIIEVTSKAGPLTSMVHSLTFVLGLKKCTGSHMCQQASRSTPMTRIGLRVGSPFIWIMCCVPKGNNNTISSILLMYLHKSARLVTCIKTLTHVLYPQTLKLLTLYSNFNSLLKIGQCCSVVENFSYFTATKPYIL